MRFRSKKQDALEREFCLSEVEEQIAHVYLDTVQNELLILPHHVSDVGVVRISCTLQALTEALPRVLAVKGGEILPAERLCALLGGDTWEQAMHGKKLVNVSRKEAAAGNAGIQQQMGAVAAQKCRVSGGAAGQCM